MTSLRFDHYPHTPGVPFALAVSRLSYRVSGSARQSRRLRQLNADLRSGAVPLNVVARLRAHVNKPKLRKRRPKTIRVVV